MADQTITLTAADVVERHDHLPIRSDEAPFAYIKIGALRIMVLPGAEGVAELVGAQLIGAGRSVRVHARGGPVGSSRKLGT